MLYVFHGSDIDKSRGKARRLVDSLLTKRPDASLVTVSDEDWRPSIVEEHCGGQGLFSSKYVVFFDRVAANDDAKEQMSGVISLMGQSSNIFIVLEGKLDADLTKSFEKSAEKVVVTDLPTKSDVGRGFALAKKDAGFNIFSLADAIGARDHFKAWSIYRQAIDKGIEVESIVGTVFWQVKSMILALGAKSAGEAGLNPFVYSKAKRYASNYSGTELSNLMREIVVVYHDGHRGVRDMELALERMLLGGFK